MSGSTQQSKPGHGRNRRRHPILPLCLLVEGRFCLVVGGGRVASRKASSLQAAGARVTVVSPDATDAIRRGAASGALTLLERAFQPEDTDGAFVVYAATDDVAVNKQVMEECRLRGVFCGIVDRGWEEGDFISPATMSAGGVTIAVSTGGKSCRRSRLVKAVLGRHLDFVDSSDLLIIGTDHRFLDLADRESLHLSGERLARTGLRLQQLAGLHEFVLVNTCNRLEMLGLAAAREELVDTARALLGLDGLSEDQMYVLKGFAAFRHLAEVAAGLHSQVPGEKHIVSQLKSAAALAEENGWAGSVMRDWLGRSLGAAKEVRQATEPVLNSLEIEDVCIRYLASYTSKLAGRRALVLGSGTVASRMIELLDAAGSRVTCCCRNHPPKVPDGTPVDLHRVDRVRDILPGYSLVITAAAAEGYLITRETVRELAPDNPLLMVDLGVPRNIDPEVAAGRNGTIEVLDLDNLRHWYRNELVDLGDCRDQAAAIIDRHREYYEQIVEQFDSGRA